MKDNLAVNGDHIVHVDVLIGQDFLSPFVTLENNVERSLHVVLQMLDNIMLLSTAHGYVAIGKAPATPCASTFTATTPQHVEGSG